MHQGPSSLTRIYLSWWLDVLEYSRDWMILCHDVKWVICELNRWLWCYINVLEQDGGSMSSQWHLLFLFYANTLFTYWSSTDQERKLTIKKQENRNMYVTILRAFSIVPKYQNYYIPMLGKLTLLSLRIVVFQCLES